jgi:hypothetical protein
MELSGVSLELAKALNSKLLRKNTVFALMEVDITKDKPGLTKNRSWANICVSLTKISMTGKAYMIETSTHLSTENLLE